MYTMNVRWLSRDILSIKYAIRDLVPLAKELERKGRDVIYLNIGDPLKYDFETPRHIIEAMYHAALEGHNYYSESQGIPELREAISRKMRSLYNVDVDPRHIVVTNGVAEAINFVVRAVADPGDEILIPSPAYPAYISSPMIYHVKPVEYRCDPEKGFEPDPDDIRRLISGRTKAILVNTPNNPTGAMYSSGVLREVMDIASEHGLAIISDEIYDRIVWGDGFTHPIKYAPEDTLYIGLNGFSKQYLMTGWRLGYIYLLGMGDEEREMFVEALLKQARARLSPNTPAQYGAVAALEGGDEHLRDMISRIRRRTELFYKLSNETGVFEAPLPRATFYIFPRLTFQYPGGDQSFVRDLLREEGVYLVHGSGFGSLGRDHVRAVTLASEDLITEAFERITRFVKRLSLA